MKPQKKFVHKKVIENQLGFLLFRSFHKNWHWLQIKWSAICNKNAFVHPNFNICFGYGFQPTIFIEEIFHVFRFV